MLSPKDLAAQYAEIRRRLRPEKNSRHRELSKKHLTLAFFVADQGDVVPWAKRMQAWNAKFPQWPYKPESESNFRRDAIRATERVLGPVVEWDAVARALWQWQGDQTENEKKNPKSSVRKRGSR